MSVYLFVLFVTTGTLPMPSPVPAQGMSIYPATVDGAARCETDGKNIVTFLNNPLKVGPGQVHVYFCIKL